PAPAAEEIAYPTIAPVDSRVLVWFDTQPHTYFGGFVLALPIFCVLIEFFGSMVRDSALSDTYDRLAKDLARVALLAMSITALVGSVMLALFILLYPHFMQYLGGIFYYLMPAYAIVFPGEALL